MVDFFNSILGFSSDLLAKDPLLWSRFASPFILLSTFVHSAEITLLVPTRETVSDAHGCGLLVGVTLRSLLDIYY